MSNQIERSIRENYIEHLLKNSQDWEWYIEYVEENFDLSLEVDSFDDFRKSYSILSDVYGSLIRINRVLSSKLSISKTWLKTLNEISLYYLGRIEYTELSLENDFFKVLALFTFSAKIYNEITQNEMLWYSEIFEYGNLYKLYDTNKFTESRDIIISGLDQIEFNTDSEKAMFLNNIDEVFIPCNTFLDEHRSSIVCADSFNFIGINGAECSTWEEKYLHDMLQTEYMNGKLNPQIGYKDGHTIPDFSAWTTPALEIMKYDFDDKDADFIIESVEYALHNKIPSLNTILKHAQLLSDYWTGESFDKNRYYVSSYEFLISFFNDNRIIIDGRVFKLYYTAIKTITDEDILLSLNSRYAFRDKNLRKRIKSIIEKKKEDVQNIATEADFLLAVEDDIIISESDDRIFNILSDKFDDVLQHGSHYLPNIFLKYLLYLIQIRTKRHVKSDEVSKEIIRIRYLWKDEYYADYVQTMSTIERSIDINGTDIDNYNDSLIKKPFGLALSCMILKEESLIETMKSISENVITLYATKILISEDFPSYDILNLDAGRHEIDLCMKEYLTDIAKSHSYKFMNDLEPEKLQFGFYKRIISQTDFLMALIKVEELIYQRVKEWNPEYELIEYDSSPKLAHLTQLFPIIENKIRYYGELIGIAPICLDIERYDQLKEPTTILVDIITMIYRSTKSFQLAADFFMIYFCLYSSFGYNIRNEAVHGKSYAKKKSDIPKAFRITLFCLYLIEYRIELCFEEKRRALSSDEDTTDEVESG
nr:hypothetical protein [uncultured Ruminococcus sp.]